MKAINLRTEYLAEPVIDIANPRFFWNCEAEGSARAQSAYRIVVKTEQDALYWDTGKVVSSKMTHIPYAGKALESRDRLVWRVMLWDENGEPSAWSGAARFEMGLLNASDWAARWITAPFVPDKKRRYPADCFKKTFVLREKPVRARLYATACGLYRTCLNGKQAGDTCFDPGFTQYDKRLQYQTFDVTPLIFEGKNELTAMLGDGWFRGCAGAYNNTNTYGTETKLLMQLELFFADGSNKMIGTDESFLWSNDGPVRENDMKNGETQDANRSPSYGRYSRLTSYKTKLVCANNVPVKEKERFGATLLITKKGERVLDFGRNIAGYAEFLPKGEKGRRLALRFGETLDCDGNFTQENYQLDAKTKHRVKQEFHYICGEGGAPVKPLFCVMGFRYVLVENWPCEVDPALFTAVAVYSAMEETGTFRCENALVNRLAQNALWSMKGNFLDVPTDCPQRERNPWTGDGQVFFETAAMFMNVAPFMRKWLFDLADVQKKSGAIPCIAPSTGKNAIGRMMEGSVGWSDAIVLIPYRFWRIYGDREILRRFYPSMQSYAAYMMRRATRPGIAKLFQGNPYWKYTYAAGRHWGEWAEPKADRFEGPFALGLPRPEEATAYFFLVMRIMAEISRELENLRDAERCEKAAEGAKKAYNRLFVKENDIMTERPAKLVRPLALGLLSGEARQNAAKRLSLLMKKRGYTVGTGFLSTPFLLDVLSENGYASDAARTLLQEGCPGWLYQVKHGATTIWENWEAPSDGASGSLNHYSKGAVCFWLFHSLAGIEMEGERAFCIRPLVIKELGHVHCSYQSVYGTVKSTWETAEGGTRFSFSVPCNTTARIVLPDGSAHTVGAGEHKFLIENKTG